MKVVFIQLRVIRIKNYGCGKKSLIFTIKTLPAYHLLSQMHSTEQIKMRSN